MVISSIRVDIDGGRGLAKEQGGGRHSSTLWDVVDGRRRRWNRRLRDKRPSENFTGTSVRSGS